MNLICIIFGHKWVGSEDDYICECQSTEFLEFHRCIRRGCDEEYTDEWPPVGMPEEVK